MGRSGAAEKVFLVVGGCRQPRGRGLGLLVGRFGTCSVLGVGVRWGHEEAPPSRGCGVVGLSCVGLGAGCVDHCPALGALSQSGVVLPAASGAVDEYVGGGLQSGVCTLDRKSTRLNSSHVSISYAVFCLKKKKAE